jgi:hypothetical protein
MDGTNMAASKKLNWEVDIGTELNWVNWDALTKFAIDVKRRRSNHTGDIVCQLSNEYKKGGLHLVRRLEFPHDQTIWVARLQLQKATPDSIERLQQEVHTIEVIREKTKIPVPEIIDYEASGTKVGVAFMLSEYIPADTAMDSFAGDKELRGRIPPAFKPNFYAKMAKIQVCSRRILKQQADRIRLIWPLYAFRKLVASPNSMMGPTLSRPYRE